MLDRCQDKNLENLYTVKQRLSGLTGKLIGLNDADKWESRELKISVSMSRGHVFADIEDLLSNNILLSDKLATFPPLCNNAK